MIPLTRLTGAQFALNPDLVERVDCTPDTVITLLDGTKYLVARDPRRRRREHPVLPGPDHRHGRRLRAQRGVRRTTHAAVRRPVRAEDRLMDKATLVGVGGGLGIIIAANVLEGGNPMSLVILPAMLLVFGGTIGAAVAGGTMADTKAAGKALVRAFTWKPAPAGELVPVVVKLADKARREGLLTLEDAAGRRRRRLPQARACSLAVDGTDPEELREILESEVDAKRAVGQARGASSSTTWAATPRPSASSAPSWAWCTCWRTCRQPDKLGHLIAGAFVATLWGVMTANMVWLPVGSRLTRLSPGRGRPHGAGHRGRPRRAGRGQPARRGAAPELAAPGPRARRRAEGRVTWPRVTQASSRGGGARQPRAVAGQLRRHDDAADGPVHRDVRDQPGRPAHASSMLKDGMAAGFGNSSSPFQGSEGTMSGGGHQAARPGPAGRAHDHPGAAARPGRRRSAPPTGPGTGPTPTRRPRRRSTASRRCAAGSRRRWRPRASSRTSRSRSTSVA